MRTATGCGTFVCVAAEGCWMIMKTILNVFSFGLKAGFGATSMNDLALPNVIPISLQYSRKYYLVPTIKYITRKQQDSCDKRVPTSNISQYILVQPPPMSLVQVQSRDLGKGMV